MGQMFTREIQPPQANPIQHGKPIQGTWTRPFERVNLAGPRIKEWQSFIIQNENIFFEAIIANLKFIRFIEVTFFDKQKLNSGNPGAFKHYFDYFPFAFWEIPDSLFNSTMEYKTLGYSINVHNYLEENIFEFLFEVDQLDELGEFNAHIYIDVEKHLPFVTNLLYSEDHCAASYKATGIASGSIKANQDEDEINLLPENTIALVRDCKGYYPYITKMRYANGFGFEKSGRMIAFSLGENTAKSANKDNENVLWVGNSLTPLPPVHITCEEGFEKIWVIEDVEGMIDLTFTPKKQINKKKFDVIVSKAEFVNPIGVFNGMIMSKTGEKITLRSLPGCAESLYIRM